MATQAFLDALLACLSPGECLTDSSDCWAYAYDNSRRHVLPDAVVFPSDTQQVQRIVRCCYAHNIPLTARGKGTGTPGGSVPVAGGVVLSTERMQNIISIEPDDRLMVVQPGVINLALQEAAKAQGFFWPPDPTSQAICTIGGNLAYNSAGPRAVKYGTPRENTLGLTLVTGTGEILKTGTRTTKGVVGYDLTRLIIGSEGTLGIITEAILKLHPLPETQRTLQVWYPNVEAATRAIAAIMAQPVIPCALEWMDDVAVDLVRKHGKLPVPEDAASLLMIVVDGQAGAIEEATQALREVAGKEACHIMVAATEEETVNIWAARKSLSARLRHLAPKKINEDVVVPVSKIPSLIAQLKALSKRTQIPIVNFGHAGNGNIHVNLLITEDTYQSTAADEALAGLFDIVLSLGGTLSGEHGIGFDKKVFIEQELSPVSINLMRDIKRIFDPKCLFNPQKIFDSAPLPIAEPA